MADLKRLDDMSTEERVAFLETLAESLLMSASIAKHEDDPLWEDLAKLGNRLQMDAETIATPCLVASNAWTICRLHALR